MTSSPPTLVGYNNNVRYRGMRFHIQTEDSGITRPHITTHLFADGGYVIRSVRTDYAEYVGHPERAAMVQQMMRDQHRAMALDLRDGKLDATIARLAPATEEPEAAPVSVPTPSEFAATPSSFAPSPSSSPAPVPTNAAVSEAATAEAATAEAAAAPTNVAEAADEPPSDTLIPPASSPNGSITERPPSRRAEPGAEAPAVSDGMSGAVSEGVPSPVRAEAPAALEAEGSAPAPSVPSEATESSPQPRPASRPAASKKAGSSRPARAVASETPSARSGDKAASNRPAASSRRSPSSKPATAKRAPSSTKGKSGSGQRPALALDSATLEQLASAPVVARASASSSSRPPSSRGAKSQRPAPSSRGTKSQRPAPSGRGAAAASSRPPGSRGSASSRAGAATSSKRPRATPTPPPPPSAPASSRRAGRPPATLPKKPSGESLFGPLPQESLDDAILSYVTKTKNGPPTRRGSK